MTKATCENDIRLLDEMIENNEYDHAAIKRMCNRYNLAAPQEETAPEDPEELKHWIDPFEGITPVLRVLAKEHYYMTFTDRQYVLKGGVRTFWKGQPVNNDECTDEQLAQMLAEGLDTRLFKTYPGKE